MFYQIKLGGAGMRGIPNTFLVGVARSGTTTITELMKLQLDFFVPEIKEPKTLAIKSHLLAMKGVGDDFFYREKPKNITDYLSQYKGVDKKYCVDASTSYLYYHSEAIDQIKKINSNPKIVIILRNPAARAISQYGLMVRDGREKLSFEEALIAEKERIENGWEYAWHYKALGHYSESVGAYLRSFDDVNVVLFEELFKGSKCDFNLLGKLFDGHEFIPFDIKENSSGEGYGRISSTLKNSMLGEFLRKNLNGFIKRWIKKYVKRKIVIDIHESEKLKLLNEYADDIAELEKLIGRSTGWL